MFSKILLLALAGFIFHPSQTNAAELPQPVKIFGVIRCNTPELLQEVIDAYGQSPQKGQDTLLKLNDQRTTTGQVFCNHIKQGWPVYISQVEVLSQTASGDKVTLMARVMLSAYAAGKYTETYITLTPPQLALILGEQV